MSGEDDVSKSSAREAMVAEEEEEEDAVEAERKKQEAALAAAKEPKSALWLVVLITSLFAAGVYDFLANVEPNGCAMTYMYEYPTYVPVEVPASVAARHPHYGLYAYGEGAKVKPLEDGKFGGIPVLFIPGNSGSHKQVRSLASVALRKAMEETEYATHFDYFSIDFNEEFSALYGGSLANQAEYVTACINHILEKVYDGRKRGSPKSIVLVGHSIGGLIAKSLFVNPNFKEKRVGNCDLCGTTTTYVCPWYRLVQSSRWRRPTNLWSCSTITRGSSTTPSTTTGTAPPPTPGWPTSPW